MAEKHGDPVYDFIKKKQDEGKACKVAKIAGFNKVFENLLCKSNGSVSINRYKKTFGKPDEKCWFICYTLF